MTKSSSTTTKKAAKLPPDLETKSSSIVSTSSTEPHRMRISTSGNVSTYVRFAVSFLNHNPHRPLILHTLPSDSKSSSSSSSNLTSAHPSKLKRTTSITTEPETKSTPSSSLHSSTLAIPRLISVVEIVKREYMEGIRTRLAVEERGQQKKNGKGKGRDVGIWQYNLSGLVDLEFAREDERGVAGRNGLDLVDVLGGKTKPKMIHRPYLQITLSTRPLLDLDKNGNMTCQQSKIKRGTHHSSSNIPNTGLVSATLSNIVAPPEDKTNESQVAAGLVGGGGEGVGQVEGEKVMGKGSELKRKFPVVGVEQQIIGKKPRK